MTAVPENELERLALLERLAILDSAPEEVFDRLTRLASHVLETPIALVTLIDANRQWIKSGHGTDLTETPRDIAFCAHALLQEEPLVVPDAANDPRFANNPLVRGAPHIRAYAGVQISSSQGLALGTLCVIDTCARAFSRKEIGILRDLAALVQRELVSREAACLSRSVHANHRVALQESEVRFQATFEQAAVGISLLDLEGRWLRVNRKLCEIVGYAEAELLNRSFQTLTYPEDIDSHVALFLATLRGARDSYSIEKRYRRRDGEPVWVDVTVSLTRDDAGQPLYFIGIVQDIEQRKTAEASLLTLHAGLETRVAERTAELRTANERLSMAIARLEESEQSLRHSRETLQTITDNLPVLIAYVDRDMRYRFNNRMYKEIFGIDPAQLLGTRVGELLGHELMGELSPYFARALDGERTSYENLAFDERSGRFWNVNYIPRFTDGVADGFYVMGQDVTERQQRELSLTQQAFHDALTGLPNRRALTRLLAAAITRARDSGKPCAVLFLDMDGLKQVNDSLGHDAGDALLKETAARLRRGVRASDTVARLAGDEFVVLLEALAGGQGDALRVAQTLLAAMAPPFFIDGRAVRSSASIGVAVSPAHTSTSAEALLDAADKAMYVAKRAGKNTFRVAGGLP